MLFSDAIQGFTLYIKSGVYSPAYVPTITGYINYMCKWLGDPDLDTITLQDWQQYFVHLRTDYKPKRINGDTSPLAEASIDNHWKIIRSFYNWAVDTQLLSSQRPDLKLARPKYQSPQVQPFTPDEIKKLIVSSTQTDVVKSNGRRYKIKRPNGDRDLSIIMMLLDTGLRVGELSRLAIGDVNLDNGEVYVRPFRSGQKTKSRTVYLGAKSRQAVWKYIAKRQAQNKLDQPLFELRGSSIRLLLRAIGKNAGIANVHPHRFRHTFAIMYLRNRGDVFTLKRLLGHSTMDMVTRYLNIVQSDLQDAHKYASPVDNL